LVLMGSSTWPGEEAALLETLRTARAAGVAARLLLVPRHAERRGEIVPLLERSGLAWHLRTSGPAPRPVDVCLADTTGEMVRLLQIADVVFIGRSLPPNDGGQTPVEAAALGRAMLFGPRMTNFRSIAQALVEFGAATVVADPAALTRESIRLLEDPAERERVGQVALAWHGRSRGAIDRTVAVLQELTRPGRHADAAPKSADEP
jgi:3-deoxy-D-manno-octulosonic-acid transferase